MGGIFLCSTTNQHLFLIYQGDDGRFSRIEGDATNHLPPFGPLKVLCVVGIEPAEMQEVLENSSKVELPLGERSAEDVWAILMQMAEQIENQEFPYALGLFGEPLNSNTAMGNLLWLVGIDVADFFPSDIIGSYIGWDRVLEFDYAIEGSSGDDDLFGRGGNQTFLGNEGNDTLIGGPDADTLSGGSDRDVLVGGPGADVFRFDGSALFDARMGIIDQVVDYDQGNAGTYSASEGDQIDLWRLLSTSYDGGNGQPIGSLVRAVEDSSGTFARLQIDVDGTVGGEDWVTIAHLGGIHLGDNLSVILDQFYPRVVITAQNSAPSVNIVNGTNGPDTLIGTAGIDQLIGLGGNDILLGGAGSDVLDGGTGFDTADYRGSLTSLTIDLAYSASNTGEAAGDSYVSIERLRGSPFNDALYGDGNDNSLDGGPGADHLNGRGGFDYARYSSASAGVTASLANPSQNTGDAAGDTYVSIEGLWGSRFTDILVGDYHSNNLDGAAGADVLNGGAGFDYARYESSSIGVTASLINPSVNTGDAIGDTYISIEGLIGSDFADTLIGDNNLNILQGRAGADFLNGQGGFDYASYGYDLAPGPITASLINPPINTGEAAGDTYISIEGLIGTPFADKLIGDSGSNWLVGGNGADLLDGQGGFDYAAYWTSSIGLSVSLGVPALNTGYAVGDSYISIEGLVGSFFNDTLIGDDNSNNLRGESGADRLIGGGGTDIAEYFEASSGLVVSLGSPSLNTGEAAGDTYISIEGISGSNFADTLIGDNGNNVLFGQSGDDSLLGGSGADLLDGGAGSDLASYANATSGVSVNLGIPTQNTGEASGDTYSSIEGLIGSNFADVLIGNSGANLLFGGGGNDKLTGGLGADTFIYAQGGGTDTITDFQVGVDKLLISGVAGVTSISNLNISQAGTSTLIVLGSGFVLENVTSDQLADSDFVFNQSPTNVTLSKDVVAENSDNGTVVGLLSTSDPDLGDSFSYSLLDDAGGRFFLSGSNLIVVGALDYEATTSYDVTVRVTDSAFNFFDKTFAISIANVNEAPTDIALSNTLVKENSDGGTVVGSLSVSDPDAAEAFGFSLADDAAGLFSINGTNLVVAGELDYERATSHNITVRVTDLAGNTFDKDFTIGTTNVNEAPIAAALIASVREDGPSLKQDLLAGAIDPDQAAQLAVRNLADLVITSGGRTLVLGTDYTLSGSNLSLTSVGFSKFNSLPALQTDQAAFHFDVSDGILATANVLTLNVVGSNDAPALVTQTPSQPLTAGTPFSLTLPANTFQDPDSGDHLTLAATLGNGTALPSWLTFNAATGIFSGTPGPSNAGGFDIKVTATDISGSAATDIFHVTVTNHAPIITSDGAGATASIIITDDTKYVDTVRATDPDPNTTIKYSIVGGQDQKLFTMDAKSGALSFKSMPQDGRSYQVQVAVSDGGLQDTQAIKVQVASGAFEFGNANVVDTFVFKPGFGLAIVSNFDAMSSNHDTLELDHALFRQADPHASPAASFDLIQHHSFQLGSDVIIVSDTHELIDLRNTNLQSLTAKDFLLV